MAIVVETDHFWKIESGVAAVVNSDGSLVVKDFSGTSVAAYAAGTWKSAVTKGDLEHVTLRGEPIQTG